MIDKKNSRCLDPLCLHFSFYRYTGRGIFLKPPTVCLCDGIWKINLPNDILSGNEAPNDMSKHVTIIVVVFEVKNPMVSFLKI